jgi:hypothetical protein
LSDACSIFQRVPIVGDRLANEDVTVESSKEPQDADGCNTDGHSLELDTNTEEFVIEWEDRKSDQSKREQQEVVVNPKRPYNLVRCMQSTKISDLPIDIIEHQRIFSP